MPVSRESEAYAAGVRAAKQGKPIDCCLYIDPELEQAFEDGWLSEWGEWFERERRCSECGAIDADWPDDKGGSLCWTCFDAASTDLFWELLMAEPGNWDTPGITSGALLRDGGQPGVA